MTADQLKTVWTTTCEQLRTVLGENIYDRWIAGIVPVSMDSHILTLGVSSETFSDWLKNHYHDLIRDIFENTTGQGITSILFESGHEAEPKPVPDTAPKHTRQKAETTAPRNSTEAVTPPHTKRPGTGKTITFNRHFSFDTFVVGENNKFAYAASTAVAEAPGQSYNPLFIHGSTGLGKTHLQQAVAQSVLQREPNIKVEYLTSEEFANKFIDALRDRELPKFRQRFRNVELLLIDDVQFFADKEQLQQEFFHTFNALYNNHKQIILTSDRPPHEINGLEKRLVSRFEWGLTTEIMVPDIETRIAILRKKQEEHTIRIDDDVLFFVANRIRSNVRRLEGALIRLVSYASLSGEEITREVAANQLQSILEEESSSALTVQDIQRAVAEHYDIRLADMTSQRRPQNIAEPRQIAMYLARTLTPCSLPQIAENFNRNHATVHHAVKCVTKKMNGSESFKNSITRLEKAIKMR